MIKFENKSNGRYYYIVVSKDLLNAIVLTITRGGRHSVRCVVQSYNDIFDMATALERISKRRIAHGYTLISP